MVKSMLIVGSSTEIGFKASGSSKSAMVSPMSKFSSPITATISPDLTSFLVFSFPSPSKR
ncbi:hypothetical protein ES708_20324 [subsurface metagenome]